MIGRIRGEVVAVGLEDCLVDVQGIGYRIAVAEPTRWGLEVGAETCLYTYLHVREDALLLYGFATEAEHDLFLLLVSVSGIGPRVALGMLSGMSPEEIRIAIASEDVPRLVRLPGIGKKTAERLILELKDKVHASIDLVSVAGTKAPTPLIVQPPSAVDEVLSALESLGYTEREVRPVVEECAAEEGEVSVLLRKVLQILGQKG